jgi:hypothetical protein
MANTFVQIGSTVTVGVLGAASIDFGSIPATYTDLQVVYSARGSAVTADRGAFVQFNADTASNYTYKFVRGDGASATSGGTTTTFLYFGNFPAATSTANTFGSGSFYIPNYAGSTAKSVSSNSVSENNGTSAWHTLAVGLWTGTAAITAIKLYPESGNFSQYSTASLYGILKS